MNLRLSAVTSAIRSPRLWGTLPLLAPGLAFANPVGGEVVGGAAAISSPDANTVRIDQSSNTAAINWQSFSVAGQEFVIFNQPSVSSATLNRVLGENPSAILGHIQANGRVFLINPNGVLFGQGAQVDVNGLVATTLDINPQDFLAGKFTFKGGSDKGVVNAGSIQTADGGFVVLAGDHAQNAGQIAARLGKVVLASGSEVTLDIKGNGLVSYAIDAAAVTDAAGVENLGSIAADGGSVVMDARVARSLAATVVNNEGLVRARTISTDQRGNIYLNGDGGNVVNQGTLDASAAEAGARAGTVVVRSTRDITLTDGSRIVASGDVGGEIRVVAEKVAALNPGSVVDATGAGGFIELSGHQRLDVNGDVNLYRGMLLIDPDRVEILGNFENGSFSPYGDSSTSYIAEAFLESQLASGNDVTLVATQQISAVGLFDNNDIDGRHGSYGNGGDLTLGVGTVASGSGGYGFYAGGTFTRGTGGGGYANGIDLGDVSVLTDGDIKIYGGTNEGGVQVGGLTSGYGDIWIEAFGDIRSGNLRAIGNDITVDSENGTLDFQDLSILADTIRLTGHNGVTLTNTTLAGASGLGNDGYTIAASHIGVYAGDSADILIQFDPVQRAQSVTAQDIVIEGGNVTIRNEILSGGHNSDNTRIIGADHINVAATGSYDDGAGDLEVDHSKLIGGQIRLDGNETITVKNEAMLAGRYEDNGALTCNSSCGAISGTFTNTIDQTAYGADLVELYGGDVTVTSSLLVAKTIEARGATVTLTGTDDNPVIVAGTAHRDGFSSGSVSSGELQPYSPSSAAFFSRTYVLKASDRVRMEGTGVVTFTQGAISSHKINIRGASVTVGADSAGHTLMGGRIMYHEQASSSGSYSNSSAEMQGADILDLEATNGLALSKVLLSGTDITLRGGSFSVDEAVIGGKLEHYHSAGTSTSYSSAFAYAANHVEVDAEGGATFSKARVAGMDIRVRGSHIEFGSDVILGGDLAHSFSSNDGSSQTTRSASRADSIDVEAQGTDSIVVSDTLMAAQTVDLAAYNGPVSITDSDIFGGAISVHGDDGVTINHSTLGGAAGVDHYGFTYAADSIDIAAGNDADVLIQYLQQVECLGPCITAGSITADDISISGGTVTISDILSGGHDDFGNTRSAGSIGVVASDYANLTNATLDAGVVSVAATHGYVETTFSDIFGGHITLDGATDVLLSHARLASGLVYDDCECGPRLEGANIIDIHAGNLAHAMYSDLMGNSINLSSGRDVWISHDSRLGGSLTGDEMERSGLIFLRAGGGEVNLYQGPRLSADTVDVHASDDIVIQTGSDFPVDAGQLRLTADGSYVYVADALDVGAITAEAYDHIEFIAPVTIGSNTALPFLGGGGPGPFDPSPNGAFRARHITVPDINMRGTHLYFQTDVLDAFDTITRTDHQDPAAIVAQFTPLTRPNLRLEQDLSNLNPADDGTALLIGAYEHLLEFPGTGFVPGAGGFTGAIAVGPVDVRPRVDNFIFILGRGATLTGLENLHTGGTVLVLRPFLTNGEANNILNGVNKTPHGGTPEDPKKKKDQSGAGGVSVTETPPHGQVEQAPSDGAQECT